MMAINGCRTGILGINSGSTCMLGVQPWKHMYVGRSMVAEHAR